MDRSPLGQHGDSGHEVFTLFLTPFCKIFLVFFFGLLGALSHLGGYKLRISVESQPNGRKEMPFIHYAVISKGEMTSPLLVMTH